jgi:hypothetical protein
LDEALGPLNVTGPTTLADSVPRHDDQRRRNSTPVLHVSGGPELFQRALTIRDGRSSAFFPTPVGGAGLFNTGTLTVNVCAFVNNQAAAGNGGDPGEAGGLAQGGGVLNAVGGVLTFNRCTFSGNSATGGRGANSFSDSFSGGMGGAAQGGALFNDSGATLHSAFAPSPPIRPPEARAEITPAGTASVATAAPVKGPRFLTAAR